MEMGDAGGERGHKTHEFFLGMKFMSYCQNLTVRMKNHSYLTEISEAYHGWTRTGQNWKRFRFRMVVMVDSNPIALNYFKFVSRMEQKVFKYVQTTLNIGYNL